MMMRSAILTATVCLGVIGVPAHTASKPDLTEFADLNGDGVVNVFDLLLLLENRG